MTTDIVTFNARAARAMRSVYDGEKSGALICETEKAKRLVFFEDGRLVGARSSLVDERLGEVLVREGRITREELGEATGFIRSGRKLGHILVELDYLRGGEIETFVRLQIIDIACAMLVSKPNRLVFSEQVPVEAVTLSPISIGVVFLEAVRRLPDVSLYRQNFLIEDYVLAQTNDALTLVQGMELSEDEGYILDLVNSENSVRDILKQSPLAQETTVRMLIALHQSGMVALKEKKPSTEKDSGPHPTPQPASVDPFETELIELYNEMQCQNHWQVLGLERDATYMEIEQAYGERSKRFEPENYQHIPDETFQEKLSFVRARFKEAFLTLSSQTSTNVYDELVGREGEYQEEKEKWEVVSSETQAPQKWDRPNDAEEAKRLFKRAQRAFKEQDFWNAIELSRQAIELSEENDPEWFHLLGRALAENPRWRKDAEQNLKIAHKLEPWEPRYLVSLGQLYEKEGLQRRAERMYEQVRTLDPGFPIPRVSPESSKKTKKAARKEKAG